MPTPRLSVLTLALAALPAAAAAQGAPDAATLAEPYEVGRRLLAAADPRGAAERFERYARACAEAAAVLAEGEPCAEAAPALARAFELRAALGDVAEAREDAEAMSRHFLYSHPRVAMGVALHLAELDLRAARWTDAVAALRRFEREHRDAPAALRLLALADLSRAHRARGRRARAERCARRVERLWDEAREELTAEPPDVRERVRAAVAGARLARAEERYRAFLAAGPALGHYRARAWVSRTRRRLLLARRAFERVWEVGSAAESVAAAARIGQMYRVYGERMAVFPNGAGVGFEVYLLRGGEDSPGYETARAHLETCVQWSAHHRVPGWSERCEAELHALDPQRYPPPAAELTARAGR